jgi:hypothetical protein
MAATAWPAPADRSVRSVSTETQVQAILIGASVPALIASTAFWLHVEWVAAIAALGVPLGAVLAVEGAGWMTGPDWIIGSLRAAFLAPLAAAALIVGGGVIAAIAGVVLEPGGLLGVQPEAVVGVIALGLLVVLVAEVVGLPVTIPTAVLVAFLLRRAARLGPAARPHVIALVVVAAVVGVVSLLAASGALGSIAPDLVPLDVG